MKPAVKERARPGGFTLVETLAVMAFLCALTAAFTVLYRGALTAYPEKEAKQLARWLTNLTTVSNRTGRSFLLNCPGNVKRNYIEATWLDPLKKETYSSAYSCEFSRYSGYNAESLYSPQWSALVPTITIRVSRNGAEHYVIVSQRGRTRTSKVPALDS